MSRLVVNAGISLRSGDGRKWGRGVVVHGVVLIDMVVNLANGTSSAVSGCSNGIGGGS